MRVLPSMTVLVPADPAETEQALRWAHGHDGPVHIRVSRMAVPAVHPEGYRFEPGKACTLRQGDDVTIVANGESGRPRERETGPRARQMNRKVIVTLTYKTANP